MKLNISAKLCYYITSILSLCITIVHRQITSVNATNEKMCDPLQLSGHSRLYFCEADFHPAKRHTGLSMIRKTYLFGIQKQL